MAVIGKSFKGVQSGLDSPGTEHLAVAPYTNLLFSVSADLVSADGNNYFTPRAVIAQGSGLVYLTCQAGRLATYSVSAGQVLPIRPLALGDDTDVDVILVW